MASLFRLLTALLFTLSLSVAQHRVTVHVECGVQNITDNEWTVDVDVEVTAPDGSKTTEHTHVDASKHSNAASIADALAHKLRKKTGLPFSTAPTTNPISNEDKGRDLVMPNNVVVKKVETRKRLDKNNEPGKQNWVQKDDHVKTYDGSNQTNKVTGTPNTGTSRTT